MDITAGIMHRPLNNCSFQSLHFQLIIQLTKTRTPQSLRQLQSVPSDIIRYRDTPHTPHNTPHTKHESTKKFEVKVEQQAERRSEHPSTL